MEMTGRFIVLNSIAKPGVKDPTKTYYNTLIMQGAQTYEANTDEVAYNKLSKLGKYTEVELVVDFHPVYKNIKIMNVFDASVKKINV